MEYMKSLRQQKGMSVQELAELCGVSSNMIWNYESGRREPPLAVLCKIADVLDVSLDNSGKFFFCHVPTSKNDYTPTRDQ